MDIFIIVVSLQMPPCNNIWNPKTKKKERIIVPHFKRSRY